MSGTDFSVGTGRCYLDTKYPLSKHQQAVSKCCYYTVRSTIQTAARADSHEKVSLIQVSYILGKNKNFSVCRHGTGPDVFCEQAATKEEAEVAHCLHQPPDIRAGEAVPLPEVPLPGRQGRDRGHTRPLKRAGQQADSLNKVFNTFVDSFDFCKKIKREC